MQPHELLKAAIADSGLTVSEVARRAGYRRGYKELHPYLTGQRPLGERVQERLTLALGLPHDYFGPVADAASVLRAFLESPHGADATTNEREAMRKVLPHLENPSVAMFRILLFALRTP
jgi:hypothetical protein